MGKREDMPSSESQRLLSAEEADCVANENDGGKEGGLGRWINSVDWMLLHAGSHYGLVSWWVLSRGDMTGSYISKTYWRIKGDVCKGPS